MWHIYGSMWHWVIGVTTIGPPPFALCLSRMWLARNSRQPFSKCNGMWSRSRTDVAQSGLRNMSSKESTTCWRRICVIYCSKSQQRIARHTVCSYRMTPEIIHWNNSVENHPQIGASFGSGEIENAKSCFIKCQRGVYKNFTYWISFYCFYCYLVLPSFFLDELILVKKETWTRS